MADGRAIARARVLLEADDRGLRRGLQQAEERTNRFSRSLKVGLVGAGAAAAGGLYLVTNELGKTIKAAQEAEAVQKRTQAQLRALGISYQQHAQHIDAVVNRTSRLAAVDDEELQQAFARLLPATRNVNKALEDMGLAADIARARNISLESASNLVLRAHTGSAGALRRLGIGMEAVTTAQDKLRDSGHKYTDAQMDAAKATDRAAQAQKNLDTLQRTFAGSAASYGQSSAGAIDRFHIAIENVRESIGQKLLPVFTPLIARFADWASKLAESKRFQEGVQRAAELLAEGLQRFGSWLVAHQEDFVSIWHAVKRALELYWAYAEFVFDRYRIGIRRVTTAVHTIIGAYRAVRDAVQRFSDWIEEKSLLTARAIVEPFSHLPGQMGGWARQAKENINRELDAIRREKEIHINARVRVESPGFGRGVGPHGEGLARAADGAIDAWIVRNGRRLAGSALGTYTGRLAPAGQPGGLKPFILDELALAQQMGLHLTSGYRPGAVTSQGHMSLHAVGQAIDVADSPRQMASFAHAAAGRPGIAEVLYTPVGGWYPGVGWTRLSGQLAKDHYSHVHVGVRGDGVVGASGDGAVPAYPSRPPTIGGVPVGQRGAFAGASARARLKQQIRDQADRAKTTADRRVDIIDREANLNARRLEAQASRTRDENQAASLRGQAAGIRAKAARDTSAIYTQLAGTLKAFANQARYNRFPDLARDLDQMAEDADFEARSRGADADEAAAEAAATGAAVPEAAAGGGGEGGGGEFGGWERTPEEIYQADVLAAAIRLAAEQKQAFAETIKAQRSAWFREFSSNVFTATPGGWMLGSSPLATQARPVIVNQNFVTPPPDIHSYFAHSVFAAQHALG